MVKIALVGDLMLGRLVNEKLKAGKNLEEAKQPATCRVKGIKIGMLAFTDNEPQWEASHALPGVHYVPVDLKDPKGKAFLELIQQLKQKVDYLIVSAHWGPNWGYDPPTEYTTFAHAMIDAGANLIFGHSPHIFRGIEVYKECPIIYSTGDFIDDYAVDEVERNDESFLFLLQLEGSRAKSLALHPTCIERFQARMAPAYRREEILAKMQALCEGLDTSVMRDADKIFLKIA
jgi:poly-gamma-glutamate capsule biosynthesis protein CapA/YwtB (metallophosphatase superfamily)